MLSQSTTFSKRIKTWLQHQYGVWVLGVISFAESALPLPVITDPFLMLYIMANQSRWRSAVVMTTFSSVIGGVMAYLVAFYFSDFVLSWFASSDLSEFLSIVEGFRAETFVLTLLGALTPVPYTLVALAAGFVQGSLVWFILASLIGRGLRYFIVGYFTHLFGVHASVYIQKHLGVISVITIIGVLIYLFLHL